MVDKTLFSLLVKLSDDFCTQSNYVPSHLQKKRSSLVSYLQFSNHVKSEGAISCKNELLARLGSISKNVEICIVY